MAAINDVAGVFTGDALELFNAMEAAVLAGGDVSGAQQRLIPVLQQIVLDKQSAPDPGNPSAFTDQTR